jgi:hypothetical protein
MSAGVNRSWLKVAVAVMAAALDLSATERINQGGRIPGSLAVVTNSILFDTTNADAVVSTMQIFPVTSPYNEDVSLLPLATNSTGIIAQISSDLPSSRQTLRLFQEMNYVVVPDSQPLVSIDFVDYPDQSDLNGGAYPYGAYPLPASSWSDVLTTSVQNASFPLTNETGFFRILSK